MFSNEINEKITKIVYLFSLADGQQLKSERTKFIQICKELGYGANQYSSLKEEYKELKLTENCDNAAVVIEKIDEILNPIRDVSYPVGMAQRMQSSMMSLLFGIRDLNKNTEAQKFLVWTLMLMGNIDNDFSEAEKKIITHLINEWQVEQIFVEVANDTLNTIIALVGEKEWYESADISEEKKQDAIKDIEDNIIQLNQDILLDIQEIQTQD